MMDRGPIFALDLGTRTGYAVGLPGAVPRSGAVLLKKPRQDRATAFANLVAWLAAEWTFAKPALVVKEAPFPLQAFANRGNSEDTVVMTYGLHAIVEAMASRFDLPIEQGHAATIRKHFLGFGRMGDRKAMKQAVVDRCRLLQLVPSDCEDHDRADAVAVHNWAASYFMGRSPQTLHLFGERARV